MLSGFLGGKLRGGLIRPDYTGLRPGGEAIIEQVPGDTGQEIIV